MLSNSLTYKVFSGELGGVGMMQLVSYKSPKKRVIAHFSLEKFGHLVYCQYFCAIINN